MANYIDSLLLDFQTKAGGVFSDTEMRTKKSQLLEAFMKNPTSVIPNWETLKTSDQRAGSVHVLKRTKRTVGNARTSDHNGSFGDSFKQDLSWKTYSLPFSVSMKLGDRNVFDNPEIFENSLKNAILDIHEEIQTDIQGYLALQKTQVAETSVGKAVWNATNFAYEISDSEKEYFWQVLKSVMSANGHRGSLDVISDSIQKMEAERLFVNGTTNAVNTAFQASGMTIFEDHNLFDTDYVGTSYAIPEGSVACLPWINPANRNNVGSDDGVTGMFTSITDPLGSGLTFGIHYKKQLTDTHNTGGERQDVVTNFEVSIDMAYVTAPLSTANETAIVKFAQKASV